MERTRSSAQEAIRQVARAGRAASQQVRGPAPRRRGGGALTHPRAGRHVLELQPLVTIGHGSSVVLKTIIQHESMWVDTAGFSRATLQVHLLSFSGSIFLKLQTSEGLDFGWSDAESLIASVSNVGETSYSLARDIARSDPSRRLRRYLRWTTSEVEGSPVSMCFRIQLQLGR